MMRSTLILFGLIVAVVSAMHYAHERNPTWAYLSLTAGGLVLVVWFVLFLFG